MCDEIHYYKQRCYELEAELSASKKTIDRLTTVLYDIDRVMQGRSYKVSDMALDAISWIIMDWKKR